MLEVMMIQHYVEHYLIISEPNGQNHSVESEHTHKINGMNYVINSSFKNGICSVAVADQPFKNFYEPIDTMRTKRNKVCQVLNGPWLSHCPNPKILVQPWIHLFLPCICRCVIWWQRVCNHHNTVSSKNWIQTHYGKGLHGKILLETG